MVYLVGRHLELRPNACQERGRKDVDEDLSHYADRAEARLIVVGRQADHSSDEFEEALKDGAADLVDKASKSWRRLSEFVSEDTEVPIGPIAFADAAETNLNHGSQNVLRRRQLTECALDGFDFGSAHGLPHDLGIEA